MYRVNSISKQLVRLNVVEAGKLQQVDLLPKNFVFTESITDQMKILEKEGVIKVRDVKASNVKASAKPAKTVSNTQPAMDGKLDFVDDADKIAKVQKKKK